MRLKDKASPVFHDHLYMGSTRSSSSLETAIPLIQINYFPFVNRTQYGSHDQFDSAFTHLLRYQKKNKITSAFLFTHSSRIESTRKANLEMKSLKKSITDNNNLLF